MNDKYINKTVMFYVNLFLFFIFTVWFVFFPYVKEYIFSDSVSVNTNYSTSDSYDFYFSLNDKGLEKMERDSSLALLNRFSFQNTSSNYRLIKEEDLNDVWNSGHYFFKGKGFDSNTHAFQAHSLFLLSDLSYAFSVTKNIEYLDQGGVLFKSWFDNNPRFNFFPSHYSWGDHTVALRLINVVSFFSYLNSISVYNIDKTLKSKFNKFLTQHIAFLLQNNNYSFKNNHGIFQDVAVLYAAQYLNNNSEIVEYASRRLLDQVKITYSSNGMHLENSPGYHIKITELISRVFSFDLKENVYLKEVQELIKKATKLNYLLLDNENIVVPIGDTAYPVKQFNTEVPSTDYFHIKDNESGSFIYKDNEVYFFAKSTGVLDTHSHQDDGSFVMGFDSGLIISEVGFLDYTNSKKRKLSKGRYSHNSLLVFDEVGSLLDTYCFIKKSDVQLSRFSVLSVCKDKNTLKDLYLRWYSYDINHGLSIYQKVLSDTVFRWEQPLQFDRDTEFTIAEKAIKPYYQIEVLNGPKTIIKENVKVIKQKSGENYGYFAETFGDLIGHEIVLISGQSSELFFSIFNDKQNYLDKSDLFNNSIDSNVVYSFKKLSRPLQILYDLRIIIYIFYFFTFVACFMILGLFLSNFVKKKIITKIFLLSGVILSCSFQLYIAYRIFLN